MLDRLAGLAKPQTEQIGLRHGGRQADAAKTRPVSLDLCQGQGDQIAALGGCHLMDFVDHHGLDGAEHIARLRIGQEQHQRFRRGQQDMWRLGALALAAIGRGIAGAALDAHRQGQRLDDRHDIAFNIVI